MEKNVKRTIIRLAATAILLAAAFIVDKSLSLPIWGKLLLYIVPYLCAGYDVLIEAFEGIIGGDVFGEDFLMSVATIGALTIGFLPEAEPQFAEAVFVMLFFKVGELFEEIAEGNSRRSISALMDIRPDSAGVERGDKILTVAPDTVEIGEVIVVRPGDKIPMDGVVIEGESNLNTVALTGESEPRSVSVEDAVMSGCINLSGVLRVRVTKSFGDSTASKILELVENAAENKSRSESFITHFARVYTPAVMLSAIALAVLPPLLSGNFIVGFADWLRRALIFLIVSCPCALVISVPLTFFGGIGSASKIGVLIKGSAFMDRLTKVKTVVFDKTGTLTEGVFTVTAVHPEKLSENRLLHLAAHVERYSTHPIAVSLRQAYPNEADDCEVHVTSELAGQGITAAVNGHSVAVGNERLMETVGATPIPCDKVGTIIHVAVDGVYAGHIVVSDTVKSDSAEAVRALKAEGVERLVMLTGDREEVAASVARELGIDEYHAALLPDGKVGAVERILAEKRGALAFVGDGINDAPVLARADIGIAMGALGSDAAIEAADVVLMDDKPSKISAAVRIAKRTISIARQNIVFALAVKLIVLAAAAFGYAPMWLAVFADVGVTVLAVINAARAG